MEVWGGSQLTSRAVEFGGLNVWVYSKPYGQAPRGGDVYYASSCATGRISRLLLADVSGHGIAVAAIAADLRTLMRRFVNHLDQSEFVRLLNQQFTALSQAGTFATAIVTTFFASTGRLMVCNAGHPRPFLYRAASRQWSFLGDEDTADPSKPSNIPLGIMDMALYEQFDVELQPGDCLIGYTDALIESRDADGEMLGEAGLLRIVRLLGDLEPSKLSVAVLKEIAERYPENLSDDDVTLLVIQASGKQSPHSLGEKLKAHLRLFGSLIRSINPKSERPPLPDMNLANIGGAIIPALGRRWRATGVKPAPSNQDE
ncbi:MAG: PP2C family protein-serine/threonine phosphatase [Candidatus Acidiferrales bacterium]|jgi:serine phosphatase RsbU (regulator of sigma subunit)